MIKKNKKIKSECCRVEITYSNPAPDFIGDRHPTIGTCTCICSKCNKPCNIYVPIRRIWKINPVIKVKGDNREQKKRKQAEKEIKEKDYTHNFNK